jgi:hypothetical protein
MPDKYASMHHAINLWAGRIVPVLILAVTGISVWVVPYQIGSKYLLQATNNPRPSTAIAILVLYFILFFPYFVSYVRLLQTMAMKPGYMEQRIDEKEKSRRRQRIKDGRGK